MTARSDLPTIEADSRPFWDAVRNEGIFLIVRCRDCGLVHHYPRPFCPRCWSGEVEWVPASGSATLYTYSVVHVNDLPPFREQLPYVAAVVELAEGPRVMTRLVDCDPERLEVGMDLTMTVHRLTEDISIPLFTPAH